MSNYGIFTHTISKGMNVSSGVIFDSSLIYHLIKT